MTRTTKRKSQDTIVQVTPKELKSIQRALDLLDEVVDGTYYLFDDDRKGHKGWNLLRRCFGGEEDEYGRHS